ncbi:FAD-dependent oxidoreductase [Skermania piniformis]|uniref:FAD-dependent oxidoreductase n=1 Tax=Skermania pinensis TaxID=39122 RepID=UPI00082AA22C|nr:FAD-dependent oxidoreductase [Skermania piniformis]
MTGRRSRVIVAGLGDSGLLTAIHLARHADVVGISPKPGLVSGQELGVRLARPDEWAERYWVPFGRYRRLDRVRIVHGTLTGVDLDARTVLLDAADGPRRTEDYDALVVATGVSNGFWRRPGLERADEVAAGLRAAHAQLAAAGSVAVVGGGAAAVSVAGNCALAWPEQRIDLYFPGDAALRSHHPRVWRAVRRKLEQRGVGIHPGHRAIVPAGFDLDRITGEPVAWSTGQSPVRADAVVWAIGRATPNTGWLPAELLDPDGFVRVAPDLRVPGRPEVFAVGDVAATDPLRSSARNRADRLVARNVRAHLAGRRLRNYRPTEHRWGSVLGAQPDGLDVFAPAGRSFRFPSWSVDTLLWPLIVRRGIYRGVRPDPPTAPHPGNGVGARSEGARPR